jgi:hypothetical protein
MELAIQLEGNAGATMFVQFPDALRQAIERGLDRATALLERAVIANALAPFGAKAGATLGELARSVRREIVHEDERSVGRVFLGSPADQYGIFVEVGTRPHFPPPAALEGWVRRRLDVTNDRQAREIAFLIGRKIARTGTPGRFLFQRALEDNVDRIVEILEEEIANALAND